MSKLTGLSHASDIAQNRTRRAVQLKEKGYPVFGYICCFAPPEIMHAAGVLPFRITGIPGDSTSEADAFMEPYGCPYVRNCFAQALKGRLDFLDGLVISHSCDMVQRLYGIWTYYRPVNYSRLVNVPHQLSPWSQDFYKRELQFFLESLESFTGKHIGSDTLRNATRLFNQNRALIRKLYQWRSSKPPRLKSSELIDVLVAGSVIPPEEFKLLLEEVCEEVDNREPLALGTPVMVWGSILDHSKLYRFIEKAGGQVVTDDTCLGTRTWHLDVPLTPDPLDGLKEHYLVSFQCPRTDRGPGLKRFAYILELAKEHGAKGVIGYTISFCDPHKLDYPDLRNFLKEGGLPMLLIDDDYSLASESALTTRIQAFLEMLG